MAEGVVADQVLDETQKELQECPICYTEYKDPRMLDCSHSFCLKCLQELRLTQNKDDKNIVCPLCRKETALTEAGVDMLPGGSKDVKQQEQTEGLKAMCQACDEENEAISRCMDCKHYLCQDCLKAHQRWAAMRAHKIVALTELSVESQEITDNELKKVPKCREHPDQDLCLYCNSCEVLICNECTNFDHKESMHSHISVDEAFAKCKQEVHESISKTEEYIKAFIAANPVSIKHSRYRLDKMLAKTYNQISQKAEKEITKIRKKEKQLKKQARDIAMKQDKDFACAATPHVQQTLSKLNKVMTTATCYEILESKKKMLRDLNEQVEVHKSLDITHGKSFLGFKESKEDGQLGTLLLEEKWETCKTLPTINGADHLAAYSTSEMVVTCSDKLHTLDQEGKVISTKTYKPDPDKPNKPHDPNDIQKATALATNKDDQLLILDNPAVKIFNKEYQLLHQFLPSKEAGMDSTPTCLAVDGSNLIAVGYKDKEQISLHNPDGSLVRTLPAPKIDTRLIFSNKRLIYTNSKEGLLMAVDLHGNKLFNQSCSYPCGLCCDDAGDIYLSASNQICHFSADGKCIASWYCQGGSDITYTPAHKLAVTEEGWNTYMYHLV